MLPDGIFERVPGTKRVQFYLVNGIFSRTKILFTIVLAFFHETLFSVWHCLLPDLALFTCENLAAISFIQQRFLTQDASGNWQPWTLLENAFPSLASFSGVRYLPMAELYPSRDLFIMGVNFLEDTSYMTKMFKWSEQEDAFKEVGEINPNLVGDYVTCF